MRQSEQHFAKAFRASPAALTITRMADRCFIDVNESYHRLVGYSREELMGHSRIELNILTAHERTEIVRKVREQGSVRNYEISVRAKSGAVRHVLFCLEIIELDVEAYILAILFDITDRKQAEEALKQTAEELARSNAELEQLAYIASTTCKNPCEP